MESYLLPSLITLTVVLIGGLIANARNIAKLQMGKLDLSDHQKICEQHNVTIDKKLDALHTLIKENHDLIEKKHDQNRTFQHDVRNELHAVSLKLERIIVKSEVVRKSRSDDET